MFGIVAGQILGLVAIPNMAEFTNMPNLITLTVVSTCVVIGTV